MMTPLIPFKNKMSRVVLFAGFLTPLLGASESAFSSASSSATRSPAIDFSELPFVSQTSHIDLSDGSPLRHNNRFKISSVTFPPLENLMPSIIAIGRRQFQTPVPPRDAYFETLKASRGEVKLIPQDVRVSFFLPRGFDASQKYKTLVYAPGSGGLCTSERAFVKRLTDELNVLVFVPETQKSRHKEGQDPSTAANQLKHNFLNISMDVLFMGELLKGHLNEKGLGALGLSLGGVALIPLIDDSTAGPLAKDSFFVGSDPMDPSSHWINTSPFEWFGLVGPIWPLQFPCMFASSGKHVSFFVGSRDMWCEPFSILRAMDRLVSAGVSLHLLKMGHAPECLWSEWDDRIAENPTMFMKLSQGDVELVRRENGENISRCTTVMPPFWFLALAGMKGFPGFLTAQQASLLAPYGSMRTIAPDPQYDEDLSGPQGMLKRTTKGTLLEPSEDAVVEIIGIMGKDIATYVTGEPWDDRVRAASRDATARTKALTAKAIDAFKEPAGQRLHAIATDVLCRPGRQATDAELLEMRACYMHTLDPLAEDVSKTPWLER